MCACVTLVQWRLALLAAALLGLPNQQLAAGESSADAVEGEVEVQADPFDAAEIKLEEAAPAVAPARLRAVIRSRAIAIEATPAEEAGPPETPSHAGERFISVRGENGRGALQTFCVAPDGNLVALVTAGGDYGIAEEGAVAEGPPAEIVVLDAAGETLRTWPLDFAAQRVACAPSGEIVVGGDGWLARFTAGGELIARQQLPPLASQVSAPGFRAEAAAKLEQTLAGYREQLQGMRPLVDQMEMAIAEAEESAAAEEKAAAERRAAEETQPPKADKQRGQAEEASAPPARSGRRVARPRRAAPARTANRAAAELDELRINLELYRQQVATMTEQLAAAEEAGVDGEITRLTEALRSVHALDVGGDAMLLTTRSTKGYGFAVWRMDLDGGNPVKVCDELSGCCGQMDAKALGGELFVAENGRHRVRRIAADGSELEAWGTRGRDGGGAGFGGCCNPMNLCFDAEGNVLTSESQGVVKRFSPNGEYLGLVVLSRLAGGCKHAAVQVSADGRQIFFLDQRESRILVLEQTAGEPPPGEAAAEQAGG